MLKHSCCYSSVRAIIIVHFVHNDLLICLAHHHMGVLLLMPFPVPVPVTATFPSVFLWDVCLSAISVCLPAVRVYNSLSSYFYISVLLNVIHSP